MKDQVRHAKFRLTHNVFLVENIVLALAVFLCLLWTCQSIAAMQRNWELSETLTREKRELELLSVEVDTLSLENDYYKTAEYQELMARKLFDKQLPGEHMVVMPENSSAALAKHEVAEPEAPAPRELSNLEQWLAYLFPSY